MPGFSNLECGTPVPVEGHASRHILGCTMACTREFDHLLTTNKQLHHCSCGRVWSEGAQATTRIQGHPPISPADMDPGHPPNPVSMDWIGGGGDILGDLRAWWRRKRGRCTIHNHKLEWDQVDEEQFCRLCRIEAQVPGLSYVPRGTETVIPPSGGSNVMPYQTVSNPSLVVNGEPLDRAMQLQIWVSLHSKHPGMAGGHEIDSTERQLLDSAIMDFRFTGAATIKCAGFWSAKVGGAYLGFAEVSPTRTCGAGDTFRLEIPEGQTPEELYMARTTPELSPPERNMIGGNVTREAKQPGPERVIRDFDGEQ